MSCCQCQGVESLFDKNHATKELKDYQKKGPSKTTSILVNALKTEGVDGASLLDIGGGVGVIQHELVNAGVSAVINVDASSAYLAVAKEESERQGYVDNAQYHYGDFVELAPTLGSADIVTLDRVICCYDDMEKLVGLSAEKAQHLYGLIFPREWWWMNLGRRLVNRFFWIRRNPYRFFIHPGKAVDELIRHKGFHRQFYQETLFWQIAVYARL